MVNQSLKQEELDYNNLWRERLLLDSLVGQILPDLIISDEQKADEILKFIKDEDVSRRDFLLKYPEYKDIAINKQAEINQRFNFAAQDFSEDFLPLVDFGHEVLEYLGELIKEREILEIQSNLDYQFQLRLALFKNFNRYLNLLLLKINNESLESVCQKLVAISDSEDFLEYLGQVLEKKPLEIIDNFLNLAKK